MNFILIEGKISTKVARARLWFDQQSESEAATASSLDVFAVSKKKIMGAKKAEESYESATSKNESGLFFIVGFFIVRNECFLGTRLRHLLLGLFFFLSFCPLLTTAKTRASLNPRCGTCSLVCFCFGEAHRFPFVLPIVDHG